MNEDWGCWTVGKYPSILGFTLTGVENAELLIYLALRGTPSAEIACTVRCDGAAPLDLELKPEQDHVVVLELDAAPAVERQVTISLISKSWVELADLTDGADKRTVGAGLRWFYVCRKEDLLARVNMAEALAMGDFRRLVRKSPRQPEFFLHT